VALAVVFGVMFVKGSVRINLQKFFRITTIILFFVAGQLVVSGLHELSENGVLPSSKAEMALIGPIVRNDVFFFVTILALAALMVLFEYRRRVPEPAAADSRAEGRKQQWKLRRERMWMVSVYASSFVFILLITAQFIYAKGADTLSPAAEVAFVNDQLSVPLAQVSDGDLHRFAATVEGTRIRFLVYQKPDGKYVALADACEICGSVGFYKDTTGIICKNCAAPIAPMSMGQPGGCNPIPLKATVTGESILISRADLAPVAAHFHE
jgi:high-affinity iron transporter